MKKNMTILLLLFASTIFSQQSDWDDDCPGAAWGEPCEWEPPEDDPPVGDPFDLPIENVTNSNAKISTFDLYINPFLSDCTDYCFEGTCFFLRCSGIFCSIETSIRISHWQPDLVVSSYKELGENPWKELNSLLSSIQKDVAELQMDQVYGPLSDYLGGAQETPEIATTDSIMQNTSSLNYREVDAIGYPWPFYYQGLDTLFCPSQATAYMPHYSSAFDAFAWRMGWLEFPYIHKVLTDAIGIPFVMEWGSVYPRIGSAHQKNDAKMSALAAQRAVDIVTQTGQPHIYDPVAGNPGSWQFFKYPGVASVDSTDHAWQMFSPKEDSSCKRFDPIAESATATESWQVNRAKLDGAGVYVLWRGRYECCADRGSYLFSIQVRVCL